MTDSVSEFREQLGELLEKAPLYQEMSVAKTFVPNVNGPTELTLACSNCSMFCRFKFEFSTATRKVDFPRSFTTIDLTEPLCLLKYKCKNCEKAVAGFLLHIVVLNDGIRLRKVGQQPPLDRRPSKELATALGKDTQGMYRKALTCRHLNLGIAAVAYLRRIVEDKLNEILDLVIEHVKRETDSNPLVSKLEAIKNETAFKNKLQRAADVLPQSLKVDGHNPLALLHGLASAGLHAESDEECVETFDRCQSAFEHLLVRLTQERIQTRAFADSVKALSKAAAEKTRNQPS